MSIINKIELSDLNKAKLKQAGLTDEDINNENAVLVSLYQQALKGNVSAIKELNKMFENTDTKEEEKEKDISKDVEKEEKRLQKIIETLPEERQKANKDFIHQLAFQNITLKNLADDIAKNGVKEKYYNGANQWGYKDRTEVKTYNLMFKNYQSAIKQFNELLLSNSLDPDDDFDTFGE